MDQCILDETEIAERVAVLKRFRALLEKQRAKFREYLSVLEKQERCIVGAESDVLLQHTALQESIIAEIFSIQKVIDPFECLYADIGKDKRDSAIPCVKNDITTLREQVLTQNRQNQALLESEMLNLQKRIAALECPYAHRESIHASSKTISQFIDVTL